MHSGDCWGHTTRAPIGRQWTNDNVYKNTEMLLNLKCLLFFILRATLKLVNKLKTKKIRQWWCVFCTVLSVKCADGYTTQTNPKTVLIVCILNKPINSNDNIYERFQCIKNHNFNGAVSVLLFHKTVRFPARQISIVNLSEKNEQFCLRFLFSNIKQYQSLALNKYRNCIKWWTTKQAALNFQRSRSDQKWDVYRKCVSGCWEMYFRNK